MTFTEQIEKAARIDLMPEGPEKRAAEDEMRTELGGQFWYGRLLDSPMFEAACQRIEKANRPKPAPVSEPDESVQTDDGMPELLPFSKLPGYLLDTWGVPHRQTGQGRKPGKVRPDNRFFTKKGRGKPQHMWRYRLTIDGARRDFYPRYLAMARLLAEKEWRKGEKSVGTKSSLTEVGGY